jgi:hypothetical protein
MVWIGAEKIMQNNLLKSLARIAARELKNTQGVHPQWKEKAELLMEAHGSDKVIEDFKAWIETVRDDKPENPVSAYLKKADARLCDAPGLSEDDPRITEIISHVYLRSKRPASKKDVSNLLDDKYTVEEIVAAWNDYSSNLDDREIKYAVKHFFQDGGARGIILARQMQKQQEKNQEEFKNAILVRAKEEADAKAQEILRARDEDDIAAEAQRAMLLDLGDDLSD